MISDFGKFKYFSFTFIIYLCTSAEINTYYWICVLIKIDKPKAYNTYILYFVTYLFDWINEVYINIWKLVPIENNKSHSKCPPPNPSPSLFQVLLQKILKIQYMKNIGTFEWNFFTALSILISNQICTIYYFC